MANRSRFAIALSSIRSFFKTNSQKIYSTAQLNGVFEENRINWNLPHSMTLDKFIDKLTASEIIKKETFEFLGYFGSKERYLVDEESSIFEIAASLVPKGYLS